ncbi:hypothetical protein B296_00036140 [Ensete ventricosum]|uniref:Uncharacterized protein n=1 Tax=Ensete ventricosum TaxID=4639 RepID=A0A426ZM87_ENSVE|nr:hypothetical protein B296_00036140 [Ensete ventricosum]
MAEVEALLKEVNMTTAEIVEMFMGCDGDGTGADAAMQNVVDELRRRRWRLKEAASPDEDGQMSRERSLTTIILFYLSRDDSLITFS